MTPPLHTQEGEQPVVKLQLTGNVWGPILTFLGFLVATVLYVGQKPDKSDVKEIVNDRVAIVDQRMDIVMKQNDQILQLLSKQNVSR